MMHDDHLETKIEAELIASHRKSRRERIATVILQGLLTNPQCMPFGMSFGHEAEATITHKAIRIADRLIEELDR